VKPARGEAVEQRDDQMEQNMEGTINTQHGDRIEGWPALPYEEWRDTCQTLHMWTQIVGKVRMELSPFLNHWWHVTLYVTPRGLSTSAIPYHGGSFDVTFDFLEHTLFLRTSEGTTKALPLIPRSVAAFYREFMDCLHALGIQVTINTLPSEVQSPIRCDIDEVHASYDPLYAQLLAHPDPDPERHAALPLAVCGQEQSRPLLLGQLRPRGDALLRSARPRATWGRSHDARSDVP
jgi:hypothetical protein